MLTASVELASKMPILMHADNIEWADRMEEWKNDADNKSRSKAGDDRTPPWRWIGCLNYDDPNSGVVTIPSEYIMRTIMAGAAQVPTGKGKQTFKSQSQSGLLCTEFHWPLLINGKKILMRDVQKCMHLATFKEQKTAAEDLGFTLYVKRAKVGASKHVRVRPRFDDWTTAGEIAILDEAITKPILAKFLEIAGRWKGLGDWRPGGATPGPWGTFDAKVT